MEPHEVQVPEHIPEADREGYIRRQISEAEAAQADERAKLKTIGQAVFGFVGMGVAVFALIGPERDFTMALGGAAASAIGFGIITVKQLQDWWAARQGR